MCYGMGCEWENSCGECTAPRSVLKCPHEEENEWGDEPEPEEPEEPEELWEIEEVEREESQRWEEKLKDQILRREKDEDDN